MKIKFITFCLLIFTVFSCNQSLKKELTDGTCEVELEKTKEKLKTVKDSLDFILTSHNFLFPKPDDINNQQSIPINEFPDPTSVNKRYGVKGVIDLKNDKIDVFVPVTENKLKIINYVNISTNNTNAILIILDGNNGNRTNGNIITKVIKKQFKISKMGLNDSLLKAHKKIKIFILHDDNFNIGHVIGYKKCITINPGYDKNQMDKCLMVNWKIGILRPDEDGGDIIP